mmetsp:Transcript_7602/g.16323  ORF Transcript_7602/g.16323 Transcript_7602/m.16323 type:complete len:190 (+) Transcript_7602:75-644(+)
MVKIQRQVIVYQHPFDAVTASLWSKYDGHKHVKEVHVLHRHIDEDGRLHSKRLLAMSGNIPAIFRPFVPLRPVFMLETVIVDPERQLMTVHTTNINMTELVNATSNSRYCPDAGASPELDMGTRYQIDISVEAFPSHSSHAVDPVASDSSAEGAGWTVGVRAGKTGYLASKLEGWVAGKLLGNVNKGGR